ncbi:glycosyltransferase family 32 protein [Mycena amicta]|nr:glycosyltransferase family 32 protein [Mycena amicta]
MLGATGSLPLHSSAVREKEHLRRAHNGGPWIQPVLVPIPGVQNRRLRVPLPALRLRRQRGPLLVCFACMAVVLTVVLVSRSLGRNEWDQSSRGEPPTLVFRRDELQRIWQWEIASGHFPSRHSIPKQIGIVDPPINPALPPKSRTISPSRYRPASPDVVSADTDTLGVGPKRKYPDIQSTPPHVSFPPRPIPGSVADLDVIMKHCDFSLGKYVRDCLEVLRMGAGLDNGQRTRRGSIEDWKYIYLEDANSTTPDTPASSEDPLQPPIYRPAAPAKEKLKDPDHGLLRKQGAKWEPPLTLPPSLTHRPTTSLPEPCDSNAENPRLFHMFWTGPFTDKPYLALLSFLFTQNTRLHEPATTLESTTVCRPQFWLWINPGPAASVPNPTALQDMFAQLRDNPWAAPFLHPRFHDVIRFKLWNTTEQLDAIDEIRDEWRDLQDMLFNSGGYIISVPDVEKDEVESTGEDTNTTSNAQASKSAGDDMLHRTGSKSSSEYDRMSVILSDMARFVLCHRFGGVYLDADTILLRDWEELWNNKRAFAYRWSRLEKYNTAVLRMNRGSALGTFLFRTALRNGLDFHPMTVSRYTADAYLEGLLLRLPDALFDAAWLNTEYFQRDRPPQPYFTEFGDFFETPLQNSAAPQALGIDGFFKGSYSYHFHNFWWKPFDPTTARHALAVALQQQALQQQALQATLDGDADVPPPIHQWDPLKENETVDDDKRDLDWAAVLKRTFESYIRGERPNLYGEWLVWP